MFWIGFLSSRRTCKFLSGVMNGVPSRVNAVEFTTGPSTSISDPYASRREAEGVSDTGRARKLHAT